MAVTSTVKPIIYLFIYLFIYLSEYDAATLADVYDEV